MELEQWIRDDMRRFIASHLPATKNTSPARLEDHGQITHKDYDTLIRRLLTQDRYADATQAFKELRDTFEGLPMDHQEERKQYYRILQRAYKQIYDYVADKHKTARIMAQLSQDANVFDKNVAPVDLDQERTGMPMPSIEDAMVSRGKEKAEEQHITVTVQQMPAPAAPIAATPPPAPEHHAEPITSTSVREPPVQHAPTPPVPKAIPSLPPASDLPKRSPHPVPQPPSPAPKAQAQKPLPSHVPDLSGMKRSHHELHIHDSPPPLHHALRTEPHEKSVRDILHDAFRERESHPNPAWHPPKLHVPPPKRIERPAHEDRRSIQLLSAQTLLHEAQRSLQGKNAKSAQEKLLEARFELARAGGDDAMRTHLERLERDVAQQIDKERPRVRDVELFSSAYLQGVQAMAAGDYSKAAELFSRRIQQTPFDRAARIRLAECMEVLNGKDAR